MPETNADIPAYPYDSVGMPEEWTRPESGVEWPSYIASIATYGAHGEKAAGSLSMKYGQPDIELLNATQAEMALLDEIAKKELLERRYTIGIERIEAFLEVHGILPSQVVIGKPQKELRRESDLVIFKPDLDETEPLSMNGLHGVPYQADMLVTRDEKSVLAYAPADCPIVIGHGLDDNDEAVLFTLHAGWQGANAGFVERALESLRDDEKVKPDTMRIVVGPGAIRLPYRLPTSNGDPLDYRFTHPGWRQDRLQNKQRGDQGEIQFEVDVYGFVLDRLDEAGINVAEQVFIDNSDTARLDSGHASNSRHNSPFLSEGDRQQAPMRDLVVGMFPQAARIANERMNQRFQNR